MNESMALSRLIGMEVQVLKARLSVAELVLLARSLKSEEGEDTDYDRGLVDLVAGAAGVAEDDRSAIARLIGVREPV